jgi:hypothetical protein
MPAYAWLLSLDTSVPAERKKPQDKAGCPKRMRASCFRIQTTVVVPAYRYNEAWHGLGFGGHFTERSLGELNAGQNAMSSTGTVQWESTTYH